MDKKETQPNKPEVSPELPSKHMEDARQDALVNTIPEDEIDNKIAEETGKDQPLPEDVEEVNNLKDSEVEQIANNAAAAVAAEPNPPVTNAPLTPKAGKLTRLEHWMGRHKVWTAVIILAVVIGILAAIPYTRFAIAGTFLKQNYRVYVFDEQTKKPVASARVIVDGLMGTTNSEGYVTISQKVGPANVDVNKPFYSATHTKTVVPILKQKQPLSIGLRATGHKTSLTVIDKISGKPIEHVMVTADDGIESSTNSKGVAELVVPAEKKTLNVRLMVGGYNEATTQITVGEALKANEFAMTPSGKVYFLSNKSGTIDVVKTDLDGSNRETVVAGTGKEDAGNTALLASRDWRYLALYSRRDGGDKQKLFLIDTASNQLSVLDEGNVQFQLIGWSGHNFVYALNRNNVAFWTSKKQAIKSFNAETRKITLLDENEATGNTQAYISENLGNYYIVGDKVVYSTNWGAQSSTLAGKSHTIRSVSVNGQNKKDVKTFDAQQYNGYIGARAYEPQSAYFWLNEMQTNKEVFFEYENGGVKEVSSDAVNLTKVYPTYLLSPSGKQTAWSDTRDGKLALFTGSATGDEEKQLPGITDYTAYGWLTDKYILATQKGSELYILSSEGSKPLKIADYYKPNLDFRGYGSGYGGL